MKRLALARCVAAVAVAASTLGAQDSPAGSARRRVAVLDFDYATVQNAVTGLMGSRVDIGQSIHVLVEAELARNGTYAVIERAQVDRILNEQNFQQNSRADASSAAKLGKLLGTDAIIIGAVTQFERENNSIAFGLKKESKATVVINARIVGVKTGEILAVAEGKGESKRSQMNTDDNNGRTTSKQPGDVWSANFGTTILGEATRAAVDSLVVQLAAAASKIPQSDAAVAGLVADATGDQLIINVGTAAGVRVGAEYVIARPGREIKDPATGNVLRRVTTPVGKIKITSADESSATGTLTGDPAHVGDCVGVCPVAPVARPPAQQEPSPALAGSTARSIAPSSAVNASPGSNKSSTSDSFTWKAYSFAGTEHFRYDALVGMGASQSGFYEIDASPAGSGRVQLRILGEMGPTSYSTTVTLAPNEPFPAAQLSQLGPAGVLLFTYGRMFTGRQWQLGGDLSSGAAGQPYTMKAESTCQYSGMQGLNGVMRRDGRTMVEVCVSPNVALPLAVTTGAYGVKLTQFRP